MLSRQIDLAALEIRQAEHSREEKSAQNYQDSTRRKKKLFDELEKESLKALKQLLAKTKEKHDSAHAISAAGPFSQMSLAQIAAHKTAIDKINPSTEVMQLYSKLLDKLVHITKEGIQKTTFFLDTTAFDASIMRGAKITLTEFSTAPKIFNIQFSANAKATAFFEPHAASLQSALNNGRHLFQIGRIDISLQVEDEKYAMKAIKRDKESEDDE